MSDRYLVWDGKTYPIPTPSPGPIDPPVDPPPPTTGVLFGAAGPQAASGAFAAWVKSGQIRAGATWNNGNDEQVGLYTLKAKGDGGGTGEFSGWPDKLLDVAIGAIDKTVGETWAQAAAGRYEARWTQSWQALRRVWGARTAGNLHVRFAHEFNLRDMNRWNVLPGEAAAFVTAWQQWAAIGRAVFPGAQRVWGVNDGTSGGFADIRSCWPGADSVDVYGADSYNAWPQTNDRAAWDQKVNRQGVGIEWHRQQAADRGVPFAIPEWSNNGVPTPASGGGGGESPFYVQAMHDWGVQHGGSGPGQVKYMILFNLWRQYQLYPTTVQPQTAAKYREIF